MGGISTSLTNEVTIAPNAAPITTATARSTTLPRWRNVLNSLSMECPPRRGSYGVRGDLDERSCDVVERERGRRPRRGRYTPPRARGSDGEEAIEEGPVALEGHAE